MTIQLISPPWAVAERQIKEEKKSRFTKKNCKAKSIRMIIERKICYWSIVNRNNVPPSLSRARSFFLCLVLLLLQSSAVFTISDLAALRATMNPLQSTHYSESLHSSGNVATDAVLNEGKQPISSQNFDSGTHSDGLHSAENLATNPLLNEERQPILSQNSDLGTHSDGFINRKPPKPDSSGGPNSLLEMKVPRRFKSRRGTNAKFKRILKSFENFFVKIYNFFFRRRRKTSDDGGYPYLVHPYEYIHPQAYPHSRPRPNEHPYEYIHPQAYLHSRPRPNEHPYEYIHPQVYPHSRPRPNEHPWLSAYPIPIPQREMEMQPMGKTSHWEYGMENKPMPHTENEHASEAIEPRPAANPYSSAVVSELEKLAFTPVYLPEGANFLKVAPGYFKTNRFIIGDGNCLFRAFAFHLSNNQENHAVLRKETVAYMRAHAKEFEDYLPGLDVSITPTTTRAEEFEEYCLNMLRDGTYGDGLSIKVLADIYALRVAVVSQEVKPSSISKIEGIKTDDDFPWTVLHLENTHYELVLRGLPDRPVAST